VILETMDFQTIFVIDVNIFLLGDSEKRLIVKPPYRSNRLLELKFTM
jgi:hypothetical protein